MTGQHIFNSATKFITKTIRLKNNSNFKKQFQSNFMLFFPTVQQNYWLLTEQMANDYFSIKSHVLIRERYWEEADSEIYKYSLRIYFNGMYFKTITRCFRYCYQVLYTREKYNYIESQKKQEVQHLTMLFIVIFLFHHFNLHYFIRENIFFTLIQTSGSGLHIHLVIKYQGNSSNKKEKKDMRPVFIELTSKQGRQILMRIQKNVKLKFYTNV